MINTLSLDNGRADFDVRKGCQRHNVSSDDTAAGEGPVVFVPADEEIVSTQRGAEDVHLLSTARSIDGVSIFPDASTPMWTAMPFGATWDVGAAQWVEQ